MAITYDTVATGVADASTVSASLTVANNSSKLLLALITVGNSADSQISQLSTVKWNTNESFTRAGFIDNLLDTSVEIWYLLNPTSTSSNVVVTADGGTPDMGLTALSLYGVNQTDSVVSFSSSTGDSLSPANNITTSVANSWIVDICAIESDSKTITAEGSQTERSNFVGGSGAGLFYNGVSTKTTTSIGDKSTSWTISGNVTKPWALAAVEVVETQGSYSPSVSPSISSSPSASPSASPSISPSKSPSTSPSVSISPSKSPSTSPSVSISPSRSPSLSPSVSPSSSRSPSLSPSKSPSTSPSISISPSASPSIPTSFSPSVSPSVSKSPSKSPSQSPSVSKSPSTSPSVSPSASASPSPSPISDGHTTWHKPTTLNSIWQEVYH